MIWQIKIKSDINLKQNEKEIEILKQFDATVFLSIKSKYISGGKKESL